ncbi:hypothetical protein VTH06DRAFT_7770 [Thermothelomyces fergusii]
MTHQYRKLESLISGHETRIDTIVDVDWTSEPHGPKINNFQLVPSRSSPSRQLFNPMVTFKHCHSIWTFVRPSNMVNVFRNALSLSPGWCPDHRAAR